MPRGSNFINLIGQQFGKLFVQERVENYKEQPQYLCICECGNIKVIRGDSLRRGITVSCGCENESILAEKLKGYFIEFYDAVTEYSMIQNPKTNHWLKCDIYIPSLNVFIEVHGIQHFQLGSWHKRLAKRKNTSPEQEFAEQCYRDQLKRRYARENGVYVEVDLRKIKTVEQAIEYVERIL